MLVAAGCGNRLKASRVGPLPNPRSYWKKLKLIQEQVQKYIKSVPCELKSIPKVYQKCTLGELETRGWVYQKCTKSVPWGARGWGWGGDTQNPYFQDLLPTLSEKLVFPENRLPA